ncbi:MAG: HDIG domain-containing protein [Clostridia bacterium]|nr:HDIG domain-containing protein [Clostridia bacterium]
MKKEVSRKQLKWTNKDVAKVATVYVVNVIVFAMLFVLLELINSNFKTSVWQVFKAQPLYLLNFLFLAMIAICFMAVFFLVIDRDFLHDPVNSEMLFLIMQLSLAIGFCCCKYVHIYFSPFAIAGLLTLYLTNSKTAIFINAIYGYLFIIFFTFLGLNTNFVGSLEQTISFFILSLASGILATFVMNGVYSRFKLIVKSFIISLPNLAGVGISVLMQGEVDLVTALLGAAFSGPIAVASFILILPIMEGLFKKVSCFKYAELTDHKSKFVRKMIEQAPGTFNHSIIVSNIAESCATAIGEDALLARTCAYYHDVGKLRRPEYFTENQQDGVNPHDELTPELSTNIIKAHALDGYNLLLKNRVPKEIAEVCLQHHGTMPMLFFYDKAKKFTDGEVDVNQFSYGGPKPQTKIAAIMMIADASEAATRTLKDRSREKVGAVVRKVVNDRMKLGQFDECEITLKEITIIINTVVNNLTGIYHRRVQYPKVSLEGLEAEMEKGE